MKKYIGIVFLAFAICNLQSVICNCSAAEKGLVAYWSFDEGKGEVAKDASGNGNDGTISGAEWCKGKIGNALSFEQGTFVEVDSEKLVLKGAISVEAWACPTDLENWRYIINWWDQYMLRLDTPQELNKFSFFVFLDGGCEPRVRGVVPEAEKWYHLVGVWDGSKIQMWVNGQNTEEQNRKGSPGEPTRTIKIGDQWIGIIDELKIYDRALTGQEIKAHYEAGAKK